jgi:small subunit ribosomal protein S17
MATKKEKAKAPKASAKPAAAPAPAPAPAPKVEAKPVAAPVHVATPSAEALKTHGFRRKLVGKITSNKMDKTVVVEVIRNAPDPVYKKYVRARERYKAHDETNQYKVGDRVEIQEHRPISRDKRWLVTRLISRPVEE